MSYVDSLRELEADLQAAVRTAKEHITDSLVVDLTQTLAGIYAPSGSVALALGDAVEHCFKQRTTNALRSRIGYHFHPNFKNTGNIAIEIGTSDNPVIVTAHGDEISYWASTYDQNSSVTIYPLHEQRFRKSKSQSHFEEVDAIAVRFDDAQQKIIPVVRGKVIKDRRTSAPPSVRATFRLSSDMSPRVNVGDRIVLDPRPRLSVEGNILRGIIDNRAGVAVLLSALIAFALRAQDDPALSGLFVITDDEEGVSSPPVFASGGQRLAKALESEERYRQSKVIVLDGHEYQEDDGKDNPTPYSIQPYPLIGGIISNGRGLALPLQAVAHVRTLSTFVTSCGGPQALFAEEVTENGGYPASSSRSDDDGFRRSGKLYSDILAVGYGVQRSHHQGGDPAETSLPNLVSTAQWLIPVLVAASHKRL